MTLLQIYNSIVKKLVAPTRLAQLEERSAFNRVVVGSIPTSGAFLVFASFGSSNCWNTNKQYNNAISSFFQFCNLQL